MFLTAQILQKLYILKPLFWWIELVNHNKGFINLQFLHKRSFQKPCFNQARLTGSLFIGPSSGWVHLYNIDIFLYIKKQQKKHYRLLKVIMYNKLTCTFCYIYICNGFWTFSRLKDGDKNYLGHLSSNWEPWIKM